MTCKHKNTRTITLPDGSRSMKLCMQCDTYWGPWDPRIKCGEYPSPEAVYP